MKLGYAVLLTVLLLIPLAAWLGCSESDDPVLAPPPPAPPPAFQDLSAKEHVVDNLVLSYTQRNLAELDSLLDDGFSFYFAAEDVAGNGFPSSWGRADEMVASTTMLVNAGGRPDSIVTIDLEIPYDTLHWDVTTVFTPDGPDERFVTTVPYRFRFTTADQRTLFPPAGARATFTVRNAGNSENPRWRLVRWEDLEVSASSSGISHASAVEEVSWGWMKERYNPQPKLADLSAKHDVINNLVVSYLRRDINEYKRILDADDYQFFFSDGDVSNGLPPGGWNRSEDEAATANLLDPFNPAPNRIVSIDLQVGMSSLVWVEIAADPPLTESWYTTTTNYSFTFKTANDISHITSGSPRTQFTVRNIGTDTAPQWRLVRWRDLGDGSFTRVAGANVEETSWGRVKALYAN